MSITHTTLKPWRTIAKPHKDVLEGTFKQSEFAADITQVRNGTATAEYQDAEKFFARTFITEGMRLLLISVAQRLAGMGGDPVIQLQTAFGGGKTHTMLAVYHLANRKVSAEKLPGIPPILDAARIPSLPQANVAVIDGINLSPSAPLLRDGLKINTLWGNLAFQLLGQDGYEMVAASDAEGTSPGKETLVALLTKAAPCVILMDELVAFIRQLELGKQYLAGTFDSNITFIQALTEALKAVPNAILLASLPESDVEAGGTMGQRALNALEKYFARVESVWKPVATEEAFEIVRRRLFDTSGETKDIQAISRQFVDFYRAHPDKFPAETQSNDYFERFCHAYPIHPEVFDRLYEDWSTLDKFQRTRGVLQYMAIVIHRLWNSDNGDALIMPGSLPLEDANVLNKSIHYLPQGWQPVIEREIDGRQSEPSSIDGHETRFGSVQAARRAARTIFLGSAPAATAQTVRGIRSERVMLGSVQPGQSVGVFEDVLKRLRDRLHYLYSEQDRFWFDTKPNLRREMESRKQQINEREQLMPFIKQQVENVFGKNHSFAGIHIFTPSLDIPDDYGTGPRLVVLGVDAGYSKGSRNKAFTAAEDILRKRGEQPRQKQNRLIFLAGDDDVLPRLKEQARIYLAWQSIVKDIELGHLNQDLAHLNQAKRNVESTAKTVSQLVRESYKWLIAPSEEFISGKINMRWESVSLSATTPNLIQEIENRLREEEWVIYEWSPIHLGRILEQWYFKNGSATSVRALKVWQDFCHYLYLPRLLNDTVYRDAITKGVASEDYFGFATGQDGERYLGFMFGQSNAGCFIDESSLLLAKEESITFKQTINMPNPIEKDLAFNSDVAHESGFLRNSQASPENHPATLRSVPDTKTHFYGTVSMDPIKAKMDFATVMDEVVQHFSSKLGVSVRISVEIQADFKNGFDQNLQRTVKENCSVLKFSVAEFEVE
jgi:predicted AAA+ superfamily ATPase